MANVAILKINEEESLSFLKGKGDAHVCDICEQSFGQKRLLTIHFREEHKERKMNFKCAYCGKNFLRKHFLKTHLCS